MVPLAPARGAGPVRGDGATAAARDSRADLRDHPGAGTSSTPVSYMTHSGAEHGLREPERRGGADTGRRNRRPATGDLTLLAPGLVDWPTLD